MAEEPVVKNPGKDEVQKEGAPRSTEGEAKVSPDAKRNELVGLAEGSLASVKLILKALEGSSLEAEAEKIRVQADAKLEELKALLAKLLAQKKAGESAELAQVLGEVKDVGVKVEAAVKAKPVKKPVVEAPVEKPGEQKEGADFEKAVVGAGNWDELIAALGGAKGFVGSTGKDYPVEQLVKGIEIIKAKDGKVSPDSALVISFPRTAGLRKKVIELINLAKIRFEFDPKGRVLHFDADGKPVLVEPGVMDNPAGVEPVDQAAEPAAASAETPIAAKPVETPVAAKAVEVPAAVALELPPTPPGQEGGEKHARLKELGDDYALKESIARKKWGGMTGLIRHAFNRKGYQEAVDAREASLKAYQEERAEQVGHSVQEMCKEQIALADRMAERMSEQKRILVLSNLYDSYKKLGDIKLSNVKFGEDSMFKGLNKITQSKFGKLLNARMAISLGLCGVGVALGGVAAPISFLATRRIVGGSMLAFGKYDSLTKGAEIFEPDIKLSPENQAELNAFSSEQKLGGVRRGLNKILGTGDKDKLFKEKKLELCAKEASKLSEAELEKAINYFEGNNVFFGKKPSENKSYIALMTEKARRGQAILDEVDGDINKEKGGAQAKFDTALEAKKQEMMQPRINEVIDYIKNWYIVDAKLFEDLQKVVVPPGTTEEQLAAKKLTPEYKAWETETERGKAMMASLPDEVQVALAAAQGDKLGRKDGMRSLLDLKTADELYKEKAEDIDPSKVADADWQLNAGVEKQIRDILGKDPKFNEEANDAFRAEIGFLSQTMADFERNRERRKDAVLGFLDAELKNHDKQVDERIVVAVKRDLYRKLAALAAGVFVASGAFGKLLSGGYHVMAGGEGAGAGAAILEQKGGGGGTGAAVLENKGGATGVWGGGETVEDTGVWPGLEDRQSTWDSSLQENDPGKLDYCNPDDYPKVEETMATPEAPIAEGMYGQGDGVINVARTLIKSGVDPKLFEGMNDTQMQKWVLDQLQDYNLPNGKKAVVDLGNGLFHYNFMPHPGGMVKFLVDENGHAKGLDLCLGDKVNTLKNGVDIATKGLVDQAAQAGERVGDAGQNAPDYSINSPGHGMTANAGLEALPTDDEDLKNLNKLQAGVYNATHNIAHPTDVPDNTPNIAPQDASGGDEIPSDADADSDVDGGHDSAPSARDAIDAHADAGLGEMKSATDAAAKFMNENLSAQARIDALRGVIRPGERLDIGGQSFQLAKDGRLLVEHAGKMYFVDEQNIGPISKEMRLLNEVLNPDDAP
ncbi:MAG: hypothetical protein UT32_C0001G0112 [Parcubacteria group bacterium GW2011_GWC2_39_14]|nr:MAG: hypothetical protein UT32_C0001G0112 [Parcubacteria group bacterium GW2011_GWC2_39_14]KKR55536.1 MAG: hypothetical protein UT91_C0001G0111 [Parcubacteria group bacterium GW2011_GWA2_40_23]